MKKNIFISIALIGIGLFCSGTQCSKEGIEYTYNFNEKINLFPVKKIYNVGDTIWLKYTNSDKKLYDRLTASYISADTVAIEFQVSFNSRYNTPYDPVDGFCDYFTSDGTIIAHLLGGLGTGIFYSFGCNINNNYNFTIGVIPKIKGIYSFDLLGIPRDVRACSNRISGFPNSTIEYSFNVADCNKDIYLSIPPNSRGESTKGYTESKIDSKQVYIVNVE